METTAAFEGVACVDCDALHRPTDAVRRCPDCGGVLVLDYDLDAVDLDRDALARRRFDGLGRYADLLSLPATSLLDGGEGATPLVACPAFADDIGVEAVYVKDEGANPTGTTADRGAALAVAAARELGADAVALPTTGDAGQSVAAYAARAGLDSEAFVPTRSTFVAKAMTNVHGGDMRVVEGRYPDAVAAFEDAMAERTGGGGSGSGSNAERTGAGVANAEEDGSGDAEGNGSGDAEGNGSGDAEGPTKVWHSLAPFDTPYRHEGAKTLLFEVLEQLDWTAPDAVVHPTGHGLGVIGSHLAVDQATGPGLLDDAEAPQLHVAQPEACAPIVAAADDGADGTEPWDRPDTLIGALEVPDPAGGPLALAALRGTGGWAVDVGDDDALEAAVTLAGEGVEASATGGVGAAAARELAEAGHLGSDDVVVLVNPVAGNKENDVLRSHLMRKGV